MIPSTPRLSTPERSARSSPRVAKTRGVAIRMTAANKPTCSRMPRNSCMERPNYAQAVLRKEKRGEHCEQGGSLNHVGEKDGHAGSPRHAFRAGDYSRIKDRGGKHAKRIEARQHGDDDPGITITRGEIGHDLLVNAADLARAGKPGERSRKGRGRENGPPGGDACIG